MNDWLPMYLFNRYFMKGKHPLKKLTMRMSQQKKSEKVLNITFMSSDESEVEEDGTKCIITHTLPWLSDVVENFKRLLDEESVWMKSP